MMRIICFIFLNAAIFTSCYSTASDKNGNFAIKGIGGVKCSKFITAKDKKDSSYLQFGGWIEGYISASNKNLVDTYDITPWQTSETLAAIIYTAGKKRPDITFAQVINQLEKQLLAESLKIKSPVIQVSNGKYSVHLPEAIYMKSIKKLTQKFEQLSISTHLQSSCSNWSHSQSS